MHRQRLISLLVVVMLAGALAACGSDDELSTQVPKTAPDLTIPTGTTETPGAATTSATTTTSTSTTPSATPTDPVAPAAPVTPPAPPAGSATTGGQAPPAGQPTTGQGGGAEFEDFCAQNPGAC